MRDWFEIAAVLLFFSDIHIFAQESGKSICKHMRAAGNRCELVTFPGGHFREPAEWSVIHQRTDEFLQSLGFFEKK